MNKKNFFLFLVILIVIACQKKSFEIKDITKNLNLEAGKETEFVIGDLFYSDHYNLEFKKNRNFSICYDKQNEILKIKPKLNFEGTALITFIKDEKNYSIPVNSYIKPKVKFSFKPKGKPKKITLFGSFNDWNRSQFLLSDKNHDGNYEISVPLEPGTYEYKFFADGEEFLDPLNSIKKANGLGGFNSIITVPPRFNTNPFLHLLNLEKDKIRFYYAGEQEQLTHQNVIALIDNRQLPQKVIEIDGNELSVILSEVDFTEKNHLRIAITFNGQTTNFQNVIFIDGKPASNKAETWYDAVIYSLMIDRFNDADTSINNRVKNDSLNIKCNYNGGDLQGIINKINENYFTDLGINTIWISPVYDNPNTAFREYPKPHRLFSGYHGYWPISSECIEENFGDMQKLKELVKVAHGKGIKILLDFVSNHVHKEHPFYKEHPEWFGNLKLADGRLNLRFWDEFRLTTWFEPYLPSFDYLGSKEALDVMTDNAVWWLENTGADGFRHDAVKHVPNTFWRKLTRKLKQQIVIPKNKTIYQVGETFGSCDLVSSYVNNGQLNGQFNFNLYNTAQSAFIDSSVSFKTLEKELKRTFKYYGSLHLMANIMDSHDKNRYIAYADGDLKLSQWSAIEEGWNNSPKVDHKSSYRKALLYLAYMNTIPGLPVIYYGSEFGMSGASDPDNRRMMRFGKALSNNEIEMLEDVKTLMNIRKNNSALRYGDFYVIKADKNIFAYLRSDCNERLLVVLNKSSKKQSVSLKIPTIYNINFAHNLLTDKKIMCKAPFNIELEGISWAIYRLEK